MGWMESKCQDYKNFKFVYHCLCKALDSVTWNDIKAIVIAYNVPVVLVKAIMALDDAEVVTSDGTFDEIKLSMGVWEDDNFAPYLYDIVIDYVLRNASNDQTLGVPLHG
jgi:hypothetical protein